MSVFSAIPSLQSRLITVTSHQCHGWESVVGILNYVCDIVLQGSRLLSLICW